MLYKVDLIYINVDLLSKCSINSCTLSYTYKAVSGFHVVYLSVQYDNQFADLKLASDDSSIRVNIRKAFFGVDLSLFFLVELKALSLVGGGSVFVRTSKNRDLIMILTVIDCLYEGILKTESFYTFYCIAFYFKYILNSIVCLFNL